MREGHAACSREGPGRGIVEFGAEHYLTVDVVAAGDQDLAVGQQRSRVRVPGIHHAARSGEGTC